ncbi:MAG: pyruvate dehydrogenase (acetyl-transferring) E1 component subunit alpha [Methanomassiliicoccales archaeon]
MREKVELKHGDMLQILDSEGNCNEELEPDIGKDLLLRIYRTMVTVRTFENISIGLQRQGRIGFYIGSAGQEACSVGSSAVLDEEDWIFPAYRETGALLMRGETVLQLFHQLFGTEKDYNKGRQMPNHFNSKKIHVVTPSSPIATQLPHAVGMAMASRYLGKKSIALTFFGDGATSENDFHSSMNFAGVFRAPVIFLCQNNGYAISLPTARQTAAETLAQKAVAYGMPSERIDGNDVLAVYAATQRAAERARKGGGPTLIEAVTYRLGPHSSSDDPTRYREDAELQEWKRKDPIRRLSLYLKKKGFISEAEDAKLQAEVEEEVRSAAKTAENTPKPPVESIFEDVYAEMPWNIREQMDETVNRYGSGYRG